MATLIRQHPNLMVGLSTLLLWAVVARLGGGAPDPGAGTKVLTVVAAIVGWPFWLAAAAVRPLLGDSALVSAVSIPLGLGICALGDWRLRRWRRVRIRERAA